MEVSALKTFEAEIKKAVPGFSVKYKDESFWLKLLGFFSYPFNPTFMTRQATTLAPVVYFPSRTFYETQNSSFATLAHEMVHLVDGKKYPFWMKFSYSLPQSLGLIPLIVYAALIPKFSWILGVVFGAYLLGCLLAKKTTVLFWITFVAGILGASVLTVLYTQWYSALFFGGLFLMVPWPSYWRSNWEMRGYTMNLAITYWGMGFLHEVFKKNVLSKFITSRYFFMSWSSTHTRSQLDKAAGKITSGSLQSEHPYSIVYQFMLSQGMVKKP
jgi:hypothetical protein